MGDMGNIYDENPTLERFRDYLKIPTVKGYGNHARCISFLRTCCDQLGFTAEIVELEDGNPILYTSFQGSDKSLPALLLNSHYDVVPAVDAMWTVSPFGADMTENGNIYARGTQDMKCVGMQYLEALSRLKASGYVPMRSIYVLFVPDEETGGEKGMGLFAATELLKSWHVGFIMDEGLANPSDTFLVFNGERSIRVLKFFFKGSAGHGSRFIKNSVGEKISKFLQILYKFRSEQEEKLENGGSCISLGEVSTCNLTMASGGVTYNVVPTEFELTVDFRLATDIEIHDFEAMLDKWVAESGQDVSWGYRFPNSVLKDHSKTELNPETNPFWRAFLNACDKLKIETQVRIFPAAADSRHLRLYGYDCIGFSPMNNTPTLLHDHDEFINKDVYLRGIKIYETIITSLSSC